jgi:hypothetical protein
MMKRPPTNRAADWLEQSRFFSPFHFHAERDPGVGLREVPVFFGPPGWFPGEIAFFRIESSRHLSDTARLILVTGRGGIIMSSITLATAAINPQLVFKANVERAIALAEEQSPADYNAILEILDRLAEGTFLGEDHDRLAAFVDRYATPRK